MNNQEYRICSRCIMDTSDPGIEFDGSGICNRCRMYEVTHAAQMPSQATRDLELSALVETIKRDGRSKDYDCVIGVSGGVDSTYAAYIVKKLGLRPLAVHMDNGWNSELAVSNIERCVKVLDIDLFTWVLDWDEFRDLQLAFLKASTPDSEIPTDHAILAVLMKKAAEFEVRYIVSGANIATEGLAVPNWSYGHYDWKYISSVHRLFGSIPLKTFPHFGLFELAYNRYVRQQRNFYVLNYVDYHKQTAMELIQRELGWQPYSGKHHESVYTRFFQSYILPRKFGYDKRKVHLSTLIMSGQLERQQAIREMELDVCSEALIRDDKIFVCKKLGITVELFDRLMAELPKQFWDYPSNEKLFAIRFYRSLRRRKQKKIWLDTSSSEHATVISSSQGSVK